MHKKKRKEGLFSAKQGQDSFVFLLASLASEHISQVRHRKTGFWAKQSAGRRIPASLLVSAALWSGLCGSKARLP
jgi:hypothetical protein